MKYKLKTIADIVKVVNERNLACFIKDFSNFITIVVNAKDNKLFKINNQDTFCWMDDGKNNIQVKFRLVEEKKKDAKKG